MSPTPNDEEGCQGEKEKGRARRVIWLTINDIVYRVDRQVPKTTTLLSFIRNNAKLPGTKAVCEEGGCGSCTVVATVRDLEKQQGTKSFSIQACQALVYACSTWKIETIEYLGDRYKGYDRLQTTLHSFYGTQCGFCSPGMIMTMQGQMKSNVKLKAEEVDQLLDGNLCRCTGYRPIVDAFKSLTEDAPQHLKEKLADIEDIHEVMCPHTGEKCKGSCKPKGENKHSIDYCSDEEDLVIVEEGEFGVFWYKPRILQRVYKILSKKDPIIKHRIVVGNTGQGVYKEDGPYNMYIDTTSIKKLYHVSTGAPLVIGANVSLARVIEQFELSAKSWQGYQYLENLAQHWRLVANVAVRNVGSWAGNLMMKHQHNEFPSDIFLTLLAVGTRITIADAAAGGQTIKVTLEEFLKVDMEGKLILSMTIPALPENPHVRSFKITPRAVNAHAYVNAVFVLKTDPNDDFRILTRPTVVLSGISSAFVRATETEKVLYGKRLTEKSLVSVASIVLGNEIHPDARPQDSSPKYRKELAQCLLFKTILGIVGTKGSAEIQSGGKDLKRPPSFSKQEFDQNKDTWPVGKPVPKLESLHQLSGEAEYVNDIPAVCNELFGYFVLTTVAKAKIKNVDISLAMKLEGVKAFITAEDIPGPNSYVSSAGMDPDPVFVNAREVLYAGQAVGLVIADSHEKAKEAARLVKVEYEDVEKPVLTIKEALKKRVEKEAEEEEKNCMCFGEKIEDVIGKSKHIIQGELTQGSQYHFMMEPLAARTVPTEEGYDVVASSQWLNETQAVIAKALKMPLNRVHVKARRLGGGFGAKISRCNIVAVASAVAAHRTHRPVRVALDLNTNMSLMGWREPYYSQYQVGFDDAGRLDSVKAVIVSDAGHVSNEASSSIAAFRMANVYTASAWNVKHLNVNTNTAANTWCRTPGTTEGVATMENIIEQVAAYLQKDPLEIREVNFAQPETPMFPKGAVMNTKEFYEIMSLLKEKAMYAERRAEVEVFNKENRWKKRGISIVPLRYEHNFPASMQYTVHVAIYSEDGTVCVSHGGIEMGQGINTKVAQVVAKVLDIDLNAVKVRASDTFISANSSVTGGCFGSDLCAHGAKVASEKLIERINIQRERMKKLFKKDPTWIDLIQFCRRRGVDLSEHYWTSSSNHPSGYDIYAAACLEVEIDVLTGQYVMRRADIVEDCGRSLSPFVDIGQIEGAFVMGLGLYTCEMVKFDENTGRKITNGTWDYKIMTAMDVPADFRITLLPNPDNDIGVVRSKATGEPALCMGYVAVTALRHAISAARADAGDHDWFNMDTPLTVESIQQLCKVDPAKFSIYSKNAEEEDFEIVVLNQIPQSELDSSCSLG